MKRTTIVLSDGRAVLLNRERKRRGVPASAIVRAVLDAYPGTRQEPFAIVGIGRSGEASTARDAEVTISAEWSYERLMDVGEACPVQERHRRLPGRARPSPEHRPDRHP